ncbi:MAG: N-acetylmuramoyl-L-alanine amidase [Candidatus Margulisbacteria bacterium]|nr:N-acetylmuramoyl-L-alanine amidase [Candidatus Margulisiibacteriota bacterium]
MKIRWFLFTIVLPVMLFSLNIQNDAIILFDGNRLDLRANPVIQNNLLNIPLEETCQRLNLSFVKSKNKLTVKNNFKTIVFHKNLDLVQVNDQKYYMPAKSFLYQSEWYVPLNYFAWYAGYTVHRKDRFYYVSKLMSKAEITEDAIKLVFSCKIDDDKFQLVRESDGSYTLALKDTIINFPRLVKSNKTFEQIYLGQITLTPDLAKLSIKTKKELDIILQQNILLIKPKDASVKIKKEEPKPEVSTITQIQAVDYGKTRASEKATWIPSFQGISNIKISVKGKKKTVTGKAKIIDNQYILPVEDILTPFGYDYYLDEKQNLFIKYGDKEEINTKVKAYKIGQEVYAPVQKLAMAIGLGLRWDYRIHTLFINPIIYDIANELQKSGDVIVVKSYNEINPKDIFQLSKPARLVLDIPNAVLDFKRAVSTVTESNFTIIRAAQLDEETVRIVADLKQAKSYGLSLSDDGTKAYIQSAGKIEKIRFEENTKTAKLVIKTSHLASTNINEKNEKLVIDFYDMTYEAKRDYYFTGSYLEKVEGLQRNWDPLAAQMTITLKPNIRYKVHADKDDLVINLYKPVKEIVVAKETKAEIKETKETKKITEEVKEVRTEVSTTPYKKLPLAGKSIVVEAGHGGIDVGAIGYGNVYEKWFTLDISKKIQNLLNEAGASVLMPLESDQYLSLSARTMFANRNRADFYLSVHLNSFGNPHYNGTETYFYKSTDYQPCKIIHEALLKSLHRVDNGVRKAHFFVLFHTNMPAVLIEPVYLSNPDEYNLLLTEDFRDKIAKAVVEGIIRYFNKT